MSYTELGCKLSSVTFCPGLGASFEGGYAAADTSTQYYSAADFCNFLRVYSVLNGDHAVRRAWVACLRGSAHHWFYHSLSMGARKFLADAEIEEIVHALMDAFGNVESQNYTHKPPLAASRDLAPPAQDDGRLSPNFALSVRSIPGPPGQFESHGPSRQLSPSRPPISPRHGMLSSPNPRDSRSVSPRKPNPEASGDPHETALRSPPPSPVHSPRSHVKPAKLPRATANFDDDAFVPRGPSPEEELSIIDSIFAESEFGVGKGGPTSEKCHRYPAHFDTEAGKAKSQSGSHEKPAEKAQTVCLEMSMTDAPETPRSPPSTTPRTRIPHLASSPKRSPINKFKKKLNTFTFDKPATSLRGGEMTAESLARSVRRSSRRRPSVRRQ